MVEALQQLVAEFGAATLGAVAVIYLLGGFVKGAIGFAMPLICVSLSAAIVPAEIAVATVILPVTISNIMQAFRDGVGEMVATAKQYWLVNAIMLVMIWISAGLLPGMDDQVFFLLLGIGVTLFALAQFLGWSPRVDGNRRMPVEAGTGVVAGFFGGIAGIWGPVIVMYLVSLRLPKADQVRAAGVTFLLGSLVLAPAHWRTGVLNEGTLPFSFLMVAPVMLGMVIGQRVQDRLDPVLFRRATLVVLCLTALNLMRRALL